MKILIKHLEKKSIKELRECLIMKQLTTNFSYFQHFCSKDDPK
jgi:hypothetical protein